MIKISQKIRGMSCVACAKSIKTAVLKIEGISEADVNFASEELFFSYDGDDKEILSKVKEVVQALGYEVINENAPKTFDKKSALLKIIYAAVILFIIAMGGMFITNPVIFKISVILQAILTSVIVFLGKHYYSKGFLLLFKRSPNMDSLIAVGTSSAYLYSLYSTVMIFMGKPSDLYFDGVGVIIALVSLGKYIEGISKDKTQESVEKLISLVPKNAFIFRDGKQMEVKAEEILKGDIIVVKEGEKISADAEVIDGVSLVDEMALTGESVFSEKKKGDKVYSATINKNGVLYCRVLKDNKDSVISKMVEMVKDAVNAKPKIARIADVLSGYFVETVIVIALLSFSFWYFNGYDFAFSLKIFVSVLIVACPCVLGLAVPVAVMIAMGKGALNGILIKNAEVLETAYKTDMVVFDKTGTLTKGEMRITDIATSEDTCEKELIKIAASAEFGSNHPLAISVINRAKEEEISLYEASEFISVSGYGIKAKVNGKEVLIGNGRFFNEEKISHDLFAETLNKFIGEGKTPILIAISGKMKGIIAFLDTIKEEALEVITTLHGMGLKTAVITGDNEKSAKRVAEEIGISKIFANVLPNDKALRIRELRDTEKKKIAFVGDGINDSLALIESDLSIAIGSGSDIAISSSDIVLLKSDLKDVVNSIKLSKSAMRIIKENLFFAFIYNVLAIPVAMGVFYKSFGIMLNPMISALLMTLSSVSVLLNTLRLKNFKKVKAKMTKKVINVYGMGCSKCEEKVRKALLNAGVSKANVNAKENKVELYFDEEKISIDKIKQQIVKTGYKLES